MNNNPYLPGTADQYIEDNLGLAHSIAWKFVRAAQNNPNVKFDKDDFMSIAYMGLIRAYQRFDPTTKEGKDGKPIQFSTYAIPMILGELMRQTRDLGYAIRSKRGGNVYSVDSLDREIDSKGKTITLGDSIQTSYENPNQIIITDFLSQIGPRLKRIYELHARGLTQKEIGMLSGGTQVNIGQMLIYIYDSAKRYGQEVELGGKYRRPYNRRKVSA